MDPPDPAARQIRCCDLRRRIYLHLASQHYLSGPAMVHAVPRSQYARHLPPPVRSERESDGNAVKIPPSCLAALACANNRPQPSGGCCRRADPTGAVRGAALYAGSYWVPGAWAEEPALPCARGKRRPRCTSLGPARIGAKFSADAACRHAGRGSLTGSRAAASCWSSRNVRRGFPGPMSPPEGCAPRAGTPVRVDSRPAAEKYAPGPGPKFCTGGGARIADENPPPLESVTGERSCAPGPGMKRCS